MYNLELQYVLILSTVPKFDIILLNEQNSVNSPIDYCVHCPGEGYIIDTEAARNHCQIYNSRLPPSRSPIGPSWYIT